MDQTQIAQMFRAQELSRREARLHSLSNNLALSKEVLTEEEQRIDNLAKKALKQAALELEKQIRPGYWQRLWAALRGK